MRIIYFDIDCLRPDHLGCYGYDRPTSPTIDSIAAEGMRFNHYYCADSPCLPSRTAMMSGRFGIHNGVTSNHGAGAKFQIDNHVYGGPKAENEMFVRHLRKNGYDTVAFSNFADRHQALWYMIGWSEFHTPNLKCGGESGDEVNEKALAWLKQNATRENYYMHINYWDTHRVYKMDKSWADRFKDFPVTQAWPDEAAIAAHQSHEGGFTAHRQFKDDKSKVDLMPGAINNRADFEHMITGYDASIAYVDAHVKEVLDELDRQGVLDDAVIIFSSDHGDAFGEHGIYSDHVCVDECIHRIPLIVRWPGKTPADGQCDSFMTNVDYAPTICDMLGCDVEPPPEKWDGQSYAENLQGRPGADRDFLVWDSSLYTVQRAVRTKEHLYIRTLDPADYNCFAPEELYDMTADPHQTTNLAADQPDRVEQLRNQMDNWVAEQQARGLGNPDPLQETLRERKSKSS